MRGEVNSFRFNETPIIIILLALDTLDTKTTISYNSSIISRAFINPQGMKVNG
jgi:hypothetical protein